MREEVLHTCKDGHSWVADSPGPSKCTHGQGAGAKSRKRKVCGKPPVKSVAWEDSDKPFGSTPLYSLFWLSKSGEPDRLVVIGGSHHAAWIRTTHAVDLDTGELLLVSSEDRVSARRADRSDLPEHLRKDWPTVKGKPVSPGWREGPAAGPDVGWYMERCTPELMCLLDLVDEKQLPLGPALEAIARNMTTVPVYGGSGKQEMPLKKWARTLGAERECKWIVERAYGATINDREPRPLAQAVREHIEHHAAKPVRLTSWREKPELSIDEVLNRSGWEKALPLIEERLPGYRGETFRPVQLALEEAC